MSVACSLVNNILDKEDLVAGISRAFKISETPLKKSDSIIIKPNLCYYWDASTGQTTSPILIGALIDFLRDRARNDPEIFIGEADASAMKTKHVFKMLGYENLSKDKEVKLLNLSSKPFVECHTTVESMDIGLTFSKKLFDSDLIINVPKLKYHRLPKVTCAMKNIFGAIAKTNKFSYHSHLARIIVAANKIINSDIILVDGLVALGNHPKIMKTLLLGQDVIAVDKICSEIMGFNPNGIKYLRLAEKEIMSKNINPMLIGEASLYELKEKFPPASYWTQRLSWGIQLWMVNAYAKIVGDTIPPMLLSE
ncbi:MAG: DUF362 domain-containing protein [Candidatus Hodarchaeota archaeon]